jgi:hypothetical protein
MKHQERLNSEQQQQHAAEQQTQQSGAREFANAEELLRYDAEQTPVPPAIAQRLQKSTGELPPPKRSWWKRLFGGTQP